MRIDFEQIRELAEKKVKHIEKIIEDNEELQKYINAIKEINAKAEILVKETVKKELPWLNVDDSYQSFKPATGIGLFRYDVSNFLRDKCIDRIEQKIADRIMSDDSIVKDAMEGGFNGWS